MSEPRVGVVVVGGSLAGVRAVESLRARGFAGSIELIAEEVGLPYDRPPLSKQILAGAWEPERIQLCSSEAIAKLDVSLREGTRAEGLDLGPRIVRTSDGDVSFERLVIATGARVRRLPGTEQRKDIHVVRTLADSLRLRSELLPGRRVVVIGAGFIGAEVAATAKGRGCNVTVLEALPTPLIRQLGEEMGRACAALHARNDVDLRTGASIATIDDDRTVHLADGARFDADVIVVGIGVQPNVEWLEGSGVLIDDGVRCDERCRVLDTNGEPIDGVVGAGDVARFPNGLFGAPDDPNAPELMRIEHWTNAAEMASHASGTLLGGTESFAPVPYFWSDQYAHKIQFLGRTTAFDEVRVVDGDPSEGSWLALYRRGDRLIGALGVTKMRLLIRYRSMLAQRASWTDALHEAGVT